MKKILFISPHLDDAVLSCGARIWQSTQAALNVWVATVFTEPGKETEHSLKALYRQRKQDDQNAIQLLGAQALHLNFTDAPFRNTQYHNFSTLLFHHRLRVTDKPVMEAVTKQLRSLLKELSPHEVWFPLGVGGHIDHHIVFESSRLLWDIPTPFHYYEDLPYALLPHWNAIRWQQLHALPTTHEPTLPPKKISLIDTPLPFVHNYLTSAEDRLSAVAQYDKEWSALESGIYHTDAWMLDNVSFLAQQTSIPPAVFAKKCEAISCYTSEWPLLFGLDKHNIRTILGIRKTENYWMKG